jgi:hypothetical protein
MTSYKDMLDYTPSIIDKTRELNEKKRTHKEMLFDLYKLYLDRALEELGAKGVDHQEPDKPCHNCAMSFAGFYLFNFLAQSDRELTDVYRTLAGELEEGDGDTNDEAEQLSFHV